MQCECIVVPVSGGFAASWPRTIQRRRYTTVSERNDEVQAQRARNGGEVYEPLMGQCKVSWL